MSKEYKFFYTLRYIGLNKNKTDSLPYIADFEAVFWDETVSWTIQSIWTHIVLSSMFVTISLYISIEITTKFVMFLIISDKNIYHMEIDTRAAARSTIVSDPGLMEYIFYNKDRTLSQHLMQLKFCLVDGMMIGIPVAKSVPSNISNQIEDEAVADQ